MNVLTDSQMEQQLKGAAVTDKSEPKMRGENVSVFYGEKQALFGVNLDIRVNQVTALIGPSGCGKSTFLRCLNRMNDTIDICRVTGSITLDNENIYDKAVDVVELRARVGMVFQKPNPFPKSIRENIAYGPRIHGLTKSKADMEEIVVTSLQKAGLFEEVKDRLDEPGTGLSGGQQQRLCLARAIAVEPEILLCDESTASLDPIAAQGIESLLLELRGHYTLVIVTHNIAQARRLADYVMFMWLGELVEHGPAQTFFHDPQEKLTQEYLARRIG